ncbi:DUF1565 domain-containing protein, partial [bacterium]|nr:DUF1565 domain-containing protein [bacterium]MBU1025188.1 DUF1565 domain-containing protein [bacterium]
MAPLIHPQDLRQAYKDRRIDNKHLQEAALLHAAQGLVGQPSLYQGRHGIVGVQETDQRRSSHLPTNNPGKERYAAVMAVPAAILAALLGQVHDAGAATHTVGAPGYPTIQSAIDSCNAYDQVVIPGGTYSAETGEVFPIINDPNGNYQPPGRGAYNIIITGSGPELTTVVGDSLNSVFKIVDSGLTELSNLTIDGNYSVGNSNVSLLGDTPQCINLHIINANIPANARMTDRGTLFDHCVFQNYGRTGFYIHLLNPFATVENCTFEVGDAFFRHKDEFLGHILGESGSVDGGNNNFGAPPAGKTLAPLFTWSGTTDLVMRVDENIYNGEYLAQALAANDTTNLEWVFD